MTAIVGILNKRAACVAADSAVTFGNGFKIHNSANKIFPVGEKHPVGIMIYGNACFIKTPWEIIINMYGNYIENDQKECLESYAQDFIHFLYQNHFFMDEQNIDSYLQNFLYHIHEFIKNEARKIIEFRDICSKSCDSAIWLINTLFSANSLAAILAF